MKVLRPMTPPERITLSEAHRLTQLEKTIKAGQHTFVKVGLALAEIRDRKLYRSDFDTFEQYTREKWGWGKSYAYLLIDAAGTVKALPPELSTIVDCESKARELAKAPVKERAAVVAEASKDGRATAKKIKAVVQKRHPQPTPTKSAEPEPAFECNSCGEKFDHEDEAVTLYECGDCGQQFSAEDTGGNRCPDCHKFAAKFTDMGCPSCGEGELSAVNTELPETQKKNFELNYYSPVLNWWRRATPVERGHCLRMIMICEPFPASAPGGRRDILKHGLLSYFKTHVTGTTEAESTRFPQA